MTGLFNRSPKDPQKKKNIEKIKEIKKLVKEKKYPQALRISLEYLRKIPNNHDVFVYCRRNLLYAK